VVTPGGDTSNAELVKDAFEEWNSGEREAFLARVDPDVEITVASSQVSGGAPYRGHDGYREWVQTMEDSFETWELHPDTFEEGDDAVLVIGRMYLRGRSSGVELDQETGWIVDVREGRMSRLRSFLSHAEARAVFESERSPGAHAEP
jgi:ketosteroid isomerase-like protein